LLGLGALHTEQALHIVQRPHPVAVRVLTQLQSGALGFATGTLEDLYLEIERLGLSANIERPAIVMSPEALEIQELGWSLSLATKLVQQPKWSHPELLALRRFLPEWLQFIHTHTGALQHQALSLLVAFDPFTEAELSALTQRVDVLLLGLSHQGAPYQSKCLSLLEAVCTRLSRSEALWVASSLRALPEMPARSNCSYLTLLKRCGAIWTREDVSVALSRCLLGHDHRAETIRVLAEAFAPYKKSLVPEPLREYLHACTSSGKYPERSRCKGLLSTELRCSGNTQLRNGLFEIFAEATKPIQEMLLDWFEELQPIGAPAWVLREDIGEPTGARTPPKGSLYKEALLRLLLEHKTADGAAMVLSTWLNDEVDRPLFEAYLKGYWLWIPSVAPRLFRVFASLSLSEVNHLCQSPTPGIQVLTILKFASTALRHAYLPLMISLWQHGAREVSAQAKQALSGVSSEVKLNFIWEEVSRGEWPLLELLHAPVFETPARAALLDKYQDKVSSWLRFIPAPLRPEVSSQEEERLLQLQERRYLPTSKKLTREELLAIARGKDEEATRKALTELSAKVDEPFIELLLSSIDSPSTRVKLHAYRLLRSCASKEIYVEASQRLLHDPLIDVQRSAIRTVMFARYLPAIPAVVNLLTHPHQAIQLTAQEGLLFNGEAALPALKKAMKDARPDKREPFQSLIKKLEQRLSDQ
jgi:hypothetical protein